MRKLSEKTRVLICHDLDFLPYADSVICIEDGSVEFEGPYELVKEHPYLKKLLKVHNDNRAEHTKFLNRDDLSAVPS